MRLNKLRAWLRGQSDTPTIGIYFGEKAATAVWLDEHDGRAITGWVRHVCFIPMWWFLAKLLIKKNLPRR